MDNALHYFRRADLHCAAQLAGGSPIHPSNQLTMRVKGLHVKWLLRCLLYT